MTAPLPRRASPLARMFETSTGTAGIAVNDARPVMSSDANGPLVLTDLSLLARVGFKGRETIAVMAERGFAIENRPNRAYRQDDGSVVLVLGASEVMILSAPEGGASGQRLDDIEWSWQIDGNRTYLVPRRDSHAWIAVRGKASADFFAKLCAIDFRTHKFPDQNIAQTSVAKLTAIVARVDHTHTPVFHLFVDSASALYFCRCLTDAAREFDGRWIGTEALGRSG